MRELEIVLLLLREVNRWQYGVDGKISVAFNCKCRGKRMGKSDERRYA